VNVSAAIPLPAGGDNEGRERLLRAARHVMRRTQWSDLKVSAVLREANVGTRYFYRHFASKEDLVSELLVAEFEYRINLYVQPLALVEDPWSRLQQWMDGLLEGPNDPVMRDRLRFLARHWPEYLRERPDAAAAAIERLLEPVRSALEQGKRIGEFPQVQPEVDARAILHLVTGVCTELLFSRLRMDADSARASVVALVGAGVARGNDRGGR
jgi:AcrR family transcriptional regulator